MMYVIKVGEFYVSDVNVVFGGFIESIELSKKLMRNFTKEGAERIAKTINGTVVSMADVITND